MNLDIPKIDRPSMLDMARTAIRLGIADKALRLGTRAAMMNPRLTAGVIRRAMPDMPDMPWQGRRGMPWQRGWRGMPWQAQSTMSRMGRRTMPWQGARGWMPWMGAAGPALPWMQRERRMPWQGGWEMPMRRQRRNGGIQPWQLLVAAAAGAVAAYLLDREQGNRRRKMAAQKTAHLARTSARELRRAGRRMGTTLAGKRQMLMHGGRSHEPLDDATLAHKVESVLFRDPHVPKGNINVNSEHGVVVLRGEVQSSADIRDIESKVRDIEGVQDVRSMLHLVHTPAP